MAVTVAGRQLAKMAIIDDDPSVRQSYSEVLEDLGFEPIDIGGPLGQLDSLFAGPLSGCDAVMTDLAIRSTGYALYDGGDIAVEGNRKQIPVLLCTAYAEVNQKLRRSQRRRVPAILSRAQFDHGLVIAGLQKCITEINGQFSPDRRPWRTQVEVVDLDTDRNCMWVIVMGRSPDERVAVFIDELPVSIQIQLALGKLLHAKVNTGARASQDLFFDEWEVM